MLGRNGVCASSKQRLVFLDSVMAIVPRQPDPSFELPTEARSGFTKMRHDGLVLSQLAATPNLIQLLLSFINHATRVRSE